MILADITYTQNQSFFKKLIFSFTNFPSLIFVKFRSNTPILHIRTTPKTYRLNFSPIRQNPIQIFLSLKYRIFVIFVIILATPIMYANNANSPQSVEAIGYEVTSTNGLVSKISKTGFGLTKDSLGQLAREIATSRVEFYFFNNLNSDQEVLKNIQGVVTGQIEKSRKLPLNEIVPIPDNPQLVNFLRYPKYNINVPVQYASLKDLFQTNEKGEFLKDKNGGYVPFEEDVARDGPLGVPIQRLLIDGIVHIGFTPQPGEIGNSYIVGHSSNFSSVQSNYNYILKPIEQISQPGEEFYVYDKSGRELKFKVFETLKIDEKNTPEAYKDFGDKRVVTLQTSILSYCTSAVTGKYGYQPCERWLTRGELVL
jgi:hypothetical protein